MALHYMHSVPFKGVPSEKLDFSVFTHSQNPIIEVGQNESSCHMSTISLDMRFNLV